MTFFIASLLIYESSLFRPIRKQNLPKGFFSGPLGHNTAIRSIFYQEPPDLSKKKCEWVEASKKALELNDYGLKCCIPAEKCKNEVIGGNPRVDTPRCPQNGQFMGQEGNGTY